MIVEILDRRNVPLEVMTPRQRITSIEVFQGLFFKLPTLGDVIGPPSSVDGDFVQFNGTTGTVIKDGGLSLDINGALGISDVKLPSQHAVKTYADNGDAATLAAANSHADAGDVTTLASANAHADAGDVSTLATAEAYTDAGVATRVPLSRLINTTSPLTGGGDLSTNRTLAIPQANGSTNGFLSATDWTRFDNIATVGVPSTRQINTTAPLTGGGDLSANRTLAIPQANGSINGFLSATDWTRFDAATAGVSSWNGRTGAVVPLANDYAESQLSFTDILANNVSAAAHGFTPKLPNDPTLFFNGLGQYVAIPGSGTGNTQLISGGGVAWTGTGLNFIISAAVYLINGVQYSSPQTPVTLAAADPTQDRIDVFYANTSGVAGVITGVPGTPPLEPSVDPGSQILLTFVYVAAASTTPGVTNENIYLEDVEYTMSTNNAGQVNLASTNNPFAGTKCIEGTAVAAGTLFTAVKPSGTLNLSNYVQLVFQVRSKASWPSQKSISIFWMNGATVVGSSVALKQGTFGFNSGQTTSYQQIVVPATSFGVASPVDRIRFSVSGGGANIGFFIDNIILQAGGGGGGGGGGTVTSFSAVGLTPLFTVAVANPTTTPALSFALSNAPAHQYFGNNAGVSGLPDFHQIAYSELSGTPAAITPSALTKTDDTNVTLALGGTPATALLQPVSLTLGWTGTLAPARGGTGAATAPAHQYFGNNTGSPAAGGFHTIDYSELTGTPTPVSVRRNFTFLSANAAVGLATGKIPGFWTCPFNGTIVGWNLTVDQGTCTVRIWKIATGTAKPTVANNINTSGLAISTGTAIRSSTVTDFTTTTVAAGDIFACEITAVGGGITELGGAIEILQT